MLRDLLSSGQVPSWIANRQSGNPLTRAVEWNSRSLPGRHCVQISESLIVAKKMCTHFEGRNARGPLILLKRTDFKPEPHSNRALYFENPCCHLLESATAFKSFPVL